MDIGSKLGRIVMLVAAAIVLHLGASDVRATTLAVSEVGELTAGYEVVEVRQNDPSGRPIVTKIPGTPFVEPIFVKIPGVSEQLIQWFESQSTDPANNRFDVDLVFYDRDDTPILRAQLEQVDRWPGEPGRQLVAFNADLGDGGPAFRRHSMITIVRAATRRLDRLISAYWVMRDDVRFQAYRRLPVRIAGGVRHHR